MSRIIPVEFSLHRADFKKDIKVEFKQVTSECLILEIKNIPSISNALELIFLDWFKSEILNLQNLFGIIFKIKEEIAEKFNENPQVVAFKFKDSIFLSFQSTLGGHESKTFWKIPEHQEFYSLLIDDDETEEICSFFREFLTGEISGGKSGILSQFINKSKISLHEIGDSDGNNLLAQAVSRNQLNVIQKLLQHEFNVDDVIDAAWKNYTESHDDRRKQEANEIILCLLKANSKFPSHFDYEEASKKVKEFVDICEGLHTDVDENDFDALKVKLEHNSNLCYFYNRQNQSLLAHALKTQKFDILDLLDKGISTGTHEDLDEVYKNMGKKDCRQLRGKHQANAREFPEPHLFALRLKSKIGNNDQFSHKHWKLIEEAFEMLNRNKYCSKILKIAALCKKLKIFFDFKHDCTFYLDPATSYYSKGIIYESGPICIGAKYLTDDEKKFEVFGVLAHELCHLAVYMAFMNRNFDPFPIGESEVKQRYIDQVMVQCEEREDCEWIVANVFESYAGNIQDSEMIVTVPQMLMHYHENHEKLTELEETFEELFKYSKEVVEPELDKALPTLQLLEEGDKSVKFGDLTEPMKAKILHSKVIFQGEDTSLFEIIGNDTEILEILESKNIRDILIKNITLEICETCEQNFKYGIIERKFFDSKIHEESKNMPMYDGYSKYDPVGLDSARTPEQIRVEYQNSKVFILADHAGTGKTTTFKYFAAELKKENKNFWVSFINLRKHEDIFAKTKQRISILTIEEVLEILVQIEAENLGIEAKIFEKLFEDGKVILLFDGVDEICPKYREVIMKMFEILCAISNKNELWISTRPHYGDKLKEIFNVRTYRFFPFNEREIKNLILKILEQINRKDYEENMKCLEVSMDVFGRLEFHSSNILMLVMIVELYISGSVDLNSYSPYGFFDAIVKMHQEKLGKKIPNEDRDPKGHHNVWTVPQVLALILLIGDDYEEKLGFKLSELSIMKLWNKEKNNWTSDMIQRYGFLNVDLNDQMKRSSIDFIHRKYAEFFVAKYLIEFIIDDNEAVRDEEIRRIYKLFELVISEKLMALQVVNYFISVYFIIDSRNRKSSFCSEIKKLMIQSVIEIHKNFEEGEKLENSFLHNPLFDKTVIRFENLAKILSLDDEISIKLWKINEEKNIFCHFIRNHAHGFPNLQKITALAQICFGPNWHEKFNRSGIDLISDESLKDMRKERIWSEIWMNDKNVLKFCDLIDKNFADSDKRFFYFNQFKLGYVSSEKLYSEILLRMKKAVDKTSYSIIILTQPNYLTVSVETLTFIHEEIEKIFDYDRESIREILFEKTRSPLMNAICSCNADVYRITVKFYEKYKNSYEDLKKVMEVSNPLSYLIATKSEFYTEYKQLMLCTIGKEVSLIADGIEKLNGRSFCFSTEEKYLENYKDFLEYIFSNDQERISAVINKTQISQIMS